MTAARGLSALGVIWAAVALATQVLRARDVERRDYSLPAGGPLGGLVYNLTLAMLPARKESVSRHPVEFGLGVTMHAGTLVALVGVLLLLIRPPASFRLVTFARPLLGLSLVAGGALFVRRLAFKKLRALSVPDDYVAVLATCGLLCMALVFGTGSRSPVPHLIYSTLLFAYMPLGKLRHAVFFFVARGEYGWRLGHRGVYPPPHARPGEHRA